MPNETKVNLNSFIIKLWHSFPFSAGDKILQCEGPGPAERRTAVLLQNTKGRPKKQEFHHPGLWKYAYNLQQFMSLHLHFLQARFEWHVLKIT